MSVVAAAALSPAAEKLRERLEASPVAARAAVHDLDLPTIEVGPEDWLALARFLRDDPGCQYDLFLDLCGVDNLRRRDRGPRSRFEAVAHLHSLSKNEHVRVRVVLPDAPDGNPSLPSVESVWPAADWFEREAYDLFGFRFPGHPNLHRILCHDAFVGHAAAQGLRARASAGSTPRRTCAIRSGPGTPRRRPATSRPRRSRSARPTRPPTGSST